MNNVRVVSIGVVFLLKKPTRSSKTKLWSMMLPEQVIRMYVHQLSTFNSAKQNEETSLSECL